MNLFNTNYLLKHCLPINSNNIFMIKLLFILSVFYTSIIRLRYGVLASSSQDSSAQNLQEMIPRRYSITGKVTITEKLDEKWIADVRILVDGGIVASGFITEDGTFTIQGIESGSYVVEVSHPRLVFKPFRVDINQRGNIRARRINYLQPSQVHKVAYPLEFQSIGYANYFQIREQWRLTDFLFQPMVLMMILPLILMMIMPKMMNAADPEMQQEMQSQMNMFSQPQKNMPDVSELLTKYLGASGSLSTSRKSARDRIKDKRR